MNNYMGSNTYISYGPKGTTQAPGNARVGWAQPSSNDLIGHENLARGQVFGDHFPNPH